MNNYDDYNKITFEAFQLHAKKTEIVDRKKEIVNKVLEFHNLNPQSYLFIGFNPLIYSLPKKTEISVVEIKNEVFDAISSQVNLTKFDKEKNPNKKFDCVIAADEYLTFAENDVHQTNKIFNLCSLTNDILITTVKDYKNQDFKEREYSHPVMIKHYNDLTSFIEIHNWDSEDRNFWNTLVYQLNNTSASFKGTFKRRSLYFKQLAKFCKDYGSNDFLVHKNLMYKSIIKKNYEHVISVRFDN